MKVLDSEVMKGYIRMCTDGFNQGWHERNGGNLSYRMKPEEVEEVKADFNENEDWIEIGADVPGLAGEYFIVTRTGKYMRNVELDPAANLCILQVGEDGKTYRILWGLTKGGKPTSELQTHLLNLEVCKQRDPNIRVVYHCHPANIVALSFVLPLDSRVFTREIFEMETECPVVFPKGIGVVPWMVCGGKEIGDATSEIMKTQDVAIWAYHGAFACGTDFDTTFGLMHTVEKAAEILVKVKSMTDYKKDPITPDQFRALGKAFHVEIDEKFLYERKTGLIGEMPED